MLFSRMDKKRDGIVRVVEVSNTVKDLCPNTTPSQLVVLERLVDTNESGEHTYVLVEYVLSLSVYRMLNLRLYLLID